MGALIELQLRFVTGQDLPEIGTRLAQDLANLQLRLGVSALPEVGVANETVLVDQVLRRPELVVEGLTACKQW